MPSIGRTALAFVVFIAATGLIALVLTPLHGTISPTAWIFVAIVCGEGIGIALAIEIARWPWKSIVANVSLPRSAGAAIVLLAAGNLLVDAGLLFPVAHLGGAESDPIFDELLGSSSGQLALAFATIVIVVPIIEELLVRGLVMRALVSKWGRATGVVGSAAIFSLLHWSWQSPFAFVSGIVWALAVLRSGNLGVAIVLHMLQNGIAFLGFEMARAADVDDAAISSVSFEVAAALVSVTVGIGLLVAGVRRLPRDPRRLDALWGLPTSSVVSAEADRFESTRSTAP